MKSYVVTGGASGVGRAITERLASDAYVVVLDPGADPEASRPNIEAVVGDAGDAAVARSAADRAEAAALLAGWVNNAAIFRDADLLTAEAAEILALIGANLGLAVTGCHTAVNHFRRHDRPGAVVNVSSHQAQRAVPGALPYATAKAAIEGLTRAVAVDHGPAGIRTNAVALGSIATDRSAQLLRAQPALAAQLAAVHPLGRIGTGAEVADVVAFLLSPQAAFVNGAVLPVDGGRAALGVDPEARPVEEA